VALQRISNRDGRGREVARQTKFPAKCLGKQLFVARLLVLAAYNSKKVARHAIALIRQVPNELADGGFFVIALQSPVSSMFRAELSEIRNAFGRLFGRSGTG
jgi:hypothetical protein